MGTPALAVPALRRLAAAGYLLTVVTQPDRPAGRGSALTPPPVKSAALELGLSVLQPPTLRDPAVVAALRALAPAAIVVFAYGEILRRAILDLPPYGCLNLHPSLLPRWRGPTPINAAILAGDRVTGVSIIRMDPGMDSGPLLAQERAPLLPDDTAATLGARLAEQGAALLVTTLSRHLRGATVAQPQPAAGVTVCRLLDKADGQLDWRQPAAALDRQVRAYDPWPGTSTHWGTRRLKVPAVRLLPDLSPAVNLDPPGTVRRLRDLDPLAEGAGRRLVVACGAGWLELTRLQLEGKAVQTADALLVGYPALVGAVLA